VLSTFFYTMIEDMLTRNDFSYAKLARILSRKKIDLKNFRYALFPVNLKH